jgi:hypothetical protein
MPALSPAAFTWTAPARAPPLELTGGGLSRAALFKGTLSDADVTIAIADGTLRAS